MILTMGSAGPTTATRMDKFTEVMLAKTGLLAMIGKAERGPQAIKAIRKHRAAYLIPIGCGLPRFQGNPLVPCARVLRPRDGGDP
jgi:tartrate dehydratase beta subunit/fumarate hydratase class I family protein